MKFNVTLGTKWDWLYSLTCTR